MSKLFIDKIVDEGKKMENTPSPDRYGLQNYFGKVGQKYSFVGLKNHSGLKLDNRHEYYLDQQRKLPGPGSYEPRTFGFGQESRISTIVSGRQSRISKASDRFVTADDRTPSPGPGSYSARSPQFGTAVLSKHKIAPGVKIGNNKIDILDERYEIRRAK